MSSKRKRKDELAARQAQRRATESEVQRFARLALNAASTAAARAAESEQQNETRRIRNAASTAAARAAELEHQTAIRRVEDALRHATIREAENPQQTAARLAVSASRFAATSSSATQDQASDRRLSNASAQRRSRETCQTSKAAFLENFDASVHGPLHAQSFVAKHMQTFHSELLELRQQHCFHCQELWPTTDAIVNPYICACCKKLSEFNSFSIQNDMVRDFSSVPFVIQKHLQKTYNN